MRSWQAVVIYRSVHLTAFLLWNANVFLNFTKLNTKFIRRVADLHTRLTRTAFLHWTAKLSSCGYSSFLSSSNRKIVRLVGDLIQSRLLRVHMCNLTSIPALQCGVGKLMQQTTYNTLLFFQCHFIVSLRAVVLKPWPAGHMCLWSGPRSNFHWKENLTL